MLGTEKVCCTEATGFNIPSCDRPPLRWVVWRHHHGLIPWLSEVVYCLIYISIVSILRLLNKDDRDPPTRSAVFNLVLGSLSSAGGFRSSDINAEEFVVAARWLGRRYEYAQHQMEKNHTLTWGVDWLDLEHWSKVIHQSCYFDNKTVILSSHLRLSILKSFRSKNISVRGQVDPIEELLLPAHAL